MKRRSFLTLLALVLVAGCRPAPMPPLPPPAPCEPTIEEVLHDLEHAVKNTPHPCWVRRAAYGRRVGAMLRAALEAK